jgi:hypothetical protein
MLRPNVFQVLLASALVISPMAGQNTDPKASDTNGNGPPAVVMSPAKSDGSHPEYQSKEDKKKAAAERPLTGFVTDADGKPLMNAIVQLKDTKSLQVRSFITREKGDYYFAGLNKDIDYEVKATFNGKSSPTRTLSSFDTKPQPVLDLQIK